MDKSEVKSALKDAKILLAKQDKGQDALIILRNVLKHDASNYQALVLEGAALQQIGKSAQSLQSYKKAITANPKQLLAWQGVVSHYEKRGIKQHEDLIEAYKNISKFYEKDEDKSKYVDSTLKFVGQLQSQNLLEQCIRVLNRLIKSNGTNIKISTMAVGILSQIPNISPEDEQLYVECLSNLHETGMATDDQYRKYFQLLYKHSEFLKLETACRDLNPRFNSFYYPLDYLCRLYIENRLSPNAVELVPSFVEKLFKLHPSSSFAHFAQGKILYQNSLVLDAITWLRQGIESNFHEEAVYVLVNCYQRIWDWEGTEELCTRMFKEKKEWSDLIRFQYALARALIQQSKMKEAMAVIEKLPHGFPTDVLRTLVQYSEGKIEDFMTLRQSLVEESPEVEMLYGEIKLQEGDRGVVLGLVEKYGENFDTLLHGGILLVKFGHVEDAFRVFHNCLGMFQNHPVLLFHLAALFIEEEDYATGLTYLRTAYRVLPSPEIGMALSDVYFKTNDVDANKELLKKATKISKKSKSKWAWLRLGMLYLEIGNPVDAVSALQSAIRTDVSDCVVWETLGDAYFSRGSYDASIRAFEQCLKQGAEPTHPKLKIGVIQRHLGEENESISTLSQLDGYTPALVELAKTYLQIATKKVKEGLSVAVVDAVNHCIKIAAKVIKTPECILGLVIITEAIILAGELNSTSWFQIPTVLLKPGGTYDDLEDISMHELLALGIQTAEKVLKNSKSESLISFQHFVLGKIYHRVYLNFSFDTITNALYHAKKAVSLSPSNPSYWNSLGVISEAAGEKSLALHAYLQSISLNSSSAATWSNLGFLLYSIEDYVSAHACFSQAQRFEPSFGLSWIGQGLVAEVLSDPERDESTDLFRHAAGLEETEMHGSLCYAYWVCRNLIKGKSKKDHHYIYTIEHLDAVDVSLEKISLYNVRRPSSASWTIQGILEAEIGLYEASLRSLDEAMQCAKDDKQSLGILKLNELIIFKSLGRWDDLLKKVEEFEFNSSPKSDQFRVLAAKALALEKRGELEESYKTYDRLLKLCNKKSDAEKSDVLISQGLVFYHLHGLKKAKNLLWKGCECAPSPDGYIALCSLALAEVDLDLAQSIVDKMSEKFQKQKYIHSIALLQSFLLVASGADEKKSFRSILSYLHKYPRSGKLWKVLANHCVNFHTDGATARTALLSACVLGQEMSLSQIALTYLLEGKIKEAVLEAQKSVFQNPRSLASIAILVFALSARDSDTETEEGNNRNKFSMKLAERGLRVGDVKSRHDETIHDWLSGYVAAAVA